MTSSLLHGEYDLNTDHLDIIELSKLLKPFFKFVENKESFERLPSPKGLDTILLLYQQQDYLAEFENGEDIIKSALQEISANFLFQKRIRQIQKNQVLEYEDYIAIYHILKAGIKLNKVINPPGLPLFDIQKINKQFKSYFQEVELLFDFQTATLVTYKHPTLKEIDSQIQGLEKEIRSKLSQISSSWSSKDLLQQSNYDIFDDKFVLPVRSDRYTSGLGRIIHRSKGGGTLYIEPFPLRELSNLLEETKAALEREIYKILNALGNILSENYDQLSPLFIYILNLDAIRGRAKLAREIGLTRPTFNNEKQFEFHQIFHPLIFAPIKNDLKLNSGQGMLISGPNTGGKTVLLKSICLSLIFPHHGLFVPAQQACLYFTDQIYFMSHDNQSLSDGLSSFSSEAITYINTMSNLGDSPVVFIDEIFNTTSSYEASLLATALIRFINEQSALTFISSHHEGLKESVYNQGLLESAHMGFKKGTGLPTYVLHQGSPGRSFAREVFLRLENELLGKPMISNFLINDKGERSILNTAVQGLDEIKEEARAQLEKNREIELQLLKEKKQLTSLLELEQKKLHTDFEKKWTQLKKETLDLAEKIKKGEVRNIIKVTDTLNHISKKSSSGLQGQQSPVHQVLPGNPTVNSRVLINKLGITGVVKKTQGKKAFVEAGKIKTWVPFQELQLVQSQKKSSQEQIKVNIIKGPRQRSMHFDARGMRRDDFLTTAEEYILDVINGELPFVDIIHGHGDGVLKSALKSIIQKYHDDIEYGHVEGNMGTTRIELKSY